MILIIKIIAKPQGGDRRAEKSDDFHIRQLPNNISKHHPLSTLP